VLLLFVSILIFFCKASDPYKEACSLLEQLTDKTVPVPEVTMTRAIALLDTIKGTNPDAALLLAQLHDSDFFQSQRADGSAAVQLYESAYNVGVAQGSGFDAAESLYLAYKEGKIVERDMKKAKEWERKMKYATGYRSSEASSLSDDSSYYPTKTVQNKSKESPAIAPDAAKGGVSSSAAPEKRAAKIRTSEAPSTSKASEKEAAKGEASVTPAGRKRTSGSSLQPSGPEKQKKLKEAFAVAPAVGVPSAPLKAKKVGSPLKQTRAKRVLHRPKWSVGQELEAEMLDPANKFSNYRDTIHPVIVKELIGADQYKCKLKGKRV